MLTEEQRNDLALKVGKVFTPSAPIDEKALFAGRTDQLRQVIDAVVQRGQHIIMFGERGVGKTSLANVIAEFLEGFGKEILAPHTNCDGTDTFSSIWRKAFAQIKISREARQVGFVGDAMSLVTSLAEQEGPEIVPDDVRRCLAPLGEQSILILIIDEFDRITDLRAQVLMADTIKTLSDHSVGVTLLLVGVADTVGELIAAHESVERALMQVRMPRMSVSELHQLLDKGLEKIGMHIEADARSWIAQLARGLPHYAHLLGLHSARQVIDSGELTIAVPHVFKAIDKALQQAQQSIITAYHQATASARENLYPQVLLACALTKRDDLGYFTASDVRKPMCEIMGRQYDIPSFARHLNDFCDGTRGRILQKTGIKHRFRFRFKNPLMEPFVLLQGLKGGSLTKDSPLIAPSTT